MQILTIVGADHQSEYNSYVSYPKMWGDAYFTIEQQIDLAIKHEAGVIWAGDVLEKSLPDSYTMSQMFEQLDRLAAAGLPLLFIQGNHEFARRQPWLAVHKWPIHIHRFTVDIPAGCVYGIDYSHPSSLREEMAGIPTIANILVCHQAWSELMGDHLPSDGSLVDLVPDNIDMVITGDFHVHKVLQLKNKAGHPFAVLSPGSSTMQSLAEDPNKYCFALGRWPAEFCSVALRNRPVHVADLISPDQAGKVISSLVESSRKSLNDTSLPVNIRTPVWHVRVDASMVDFVPKLKEIARSIAHLFIRPYGGGVVEEKVGMTRGFSTFEEAIVGELGDRVSIRDSAIRLWRSTDPKLEAETIANEIIKHEEEKYGCG